MLQPYFIVTWICGIFLSGVELVIVLFHCLCIVDIQTDQLSPVDFCKRVNPLLVPEVIIQFILTLIYIPHFFIFELLFTIPLLSLDIYHFFNASFKYNPVTVFTNIHRKEVIGYLKICYYLLFIFISIGRILFHVITSE
ncbi:Cornichon protein, putative [Entamoeba histolytica]